MEHSLDDSHTLYILITISGVVDKKGVITAMSELFTHPDFQSKHTMWDFTRASMGLSIGDLREIIGILKLFKPPRKNFANRVALVVPMRMEMNMAKIFLSISKLLPFDYKVFENREQTLPFLTSDTD